MCVCVCVTGMRPDAVVEHDCPVLHAAAAVRTEQIWQRLGSDDGRVAAVHMIASHSLYICGYIVAVAA